MLRPLVLSIATAVLLAACGETPAPTPAPAPPPVVTPSPAPQSFPESTNAEANALFLDARAKGLDRSRQGTAASIALLEKAVRIDRKFARAHAELAVAYGTIDEATDPLVRRPRAKAAAERALKLDPASASAIAAMAFVSYRFDWEWSRAEAGFTKATGANPNDAFARHQYGVFLAAVGRTDDALRELTRAAELDAAAVGIRADMVRPLLKAGRVPEARTALDVFAARVSSGPLLEQLRAEVVTAEGKNPVSTMKAATERHIRQLRAEVENGPTPPKSYRLATDLALAYASLQQKDQTLHWLAVAIDLHEDAPLYMLSSTVFDFLRGEPRFKELLQRAKLEEK